MILVIVFNIINFLIDIYSKSKRFNDFFIKSGIVYVIGREDRKRVIFRKLLNGLVFDFVLCIFLFYFLVFFRLFFRNINLESIKFCF